MKKEDCCPRIDRSDCSEGKVEERKGRGWGQLRVRVRKRKIKGVCCEIE